MTTDADGTELVEVSISPSASHWVPAIGQETQDLLQHFGQKLDDDGKQNLTEATARIMGHCVDPSGPPATSTGLVIGYVQSGKTMSFTTVAAMAADNGYPLIIVITGTTNNLFEQSAERLERDLRLDSRPDRKWQHFREPTRTHGDRLNQLLEDWRDPSVPPADRQIVLLTLKKNWSVLRKVIQLLSGINRDGIPALIIDDEADQASLNTKVQQNEESPTYARLLQLRNLFPRHTFLQYTATPQANLLINILDVLSPDFAELLLPGEDYTGGIEFFGADQSLIRIIPANERPSRQNPISDMPQSLIEAMRMFFVGVAAGTTLGDANRGNRTMLIHPSRETDPHGDFAHWARQLKQAWEQTLTLQPTDPDFIELQADFRASYDELAATVGSSMPDWDATANTLRRAIRRANVVEVNSTPRRTTEIPWRDEYAWVLVGGQALDRGFTVEGLTVTYMPRGLGIGNADTLQQRARFFGYKRGYLGYCRIFLDADVIDAFTDYVVHEENVRQQLEQFRATGLPLDQWKRAFLMPQGLQPTRQNVLSLDHLRDSFADRWFWIRSPHTSDSIIADNRAVFDSFISSHAFFPIAPELYGQTATRNHGAVAVPLLDVYENLLVRLKIPEAEDTQAYLGAMLQIYHYLQSHTDEVCDVYFMNPNEDTRRAVDGTTQRIENIFQGSNRAPADPLYYPGDRELHGQARLTVQLRRLTLTDAGQDIAIDTPVLAIWIPDKMEQHWLVQDPQS